MEGEIINRVASSPLITVNLEDWYVKGPRYTLDLGQWLEEGLILREKPFREALAAYPWENYQNGLVCLQAPEDVVIPIWAYMLLGTYLQPVAKKVVAGTPELLETVLFQEQFQTADLSIYENRPVIIKGCSTFPVPLSAYVWAIQKIQTVAKSVMFGEACSSVPLYRTSK